MLFIIIAVSLSVPLAVAHSQAQMTTYLPIVEKSVPPTPVDLVLDDGTFEFIARGVGSFLWLNRFTPNADEFPFTLTSIHVFFAGVYGSSVPCAVGDPMDIYVWTDDDNDPSNGATYLGYVAGSVQANDDWSEYDLNLEITSPGDVLIGVINRGCVGDLNFPATADHTSSQMRSWMGNYVNGTPSHPPSFPPDTFWLIDDLGSGGGNWLVRGYGQHTNGSTIVLE